VDIHAYIRELTNPAKRTTLPSIDGRLRKAIPAVISQKQGYRYGLRYRGLFGPYPFFITKKAVESTSKDGKRDEKREAQKSEAFGAGRQATAPAPPSLAVTSSERRASVNNYGENENMTDEMGIRICPPDTQTKKANPKRGA
jgi:hypothetical protein